MISSWEKSEQGNEERPGSIIFNLPAWTEQGNGKPVADIVQKQKLWQLAHKLELSIMLLGLLLKLLNNPWPIILIIG